jgi:L-lactate dehydrogenase complex protein LldE
MLQVGLFVPCYVNQFYPQVAVATLELLEKNGCQVSFPLEQTCCGQPMANSGYESLGKGCVANFYEQFKAFDYVVCPSGSCTLHLVEQLHHDHKPLKVYELCEFLVDVLKLDSIEASFPHKVGMHQSCHGQRGLKLSQMSELHAAPFSKPEQLLKQVKGLELVNLARKDECCGFGGTFCVTEEAISVKMGADRIQDHTQAQAEYIIGGDMSCLMHLEGILKRQKSSLKIKHIAEILNAHE